MDNTCRTEGKYCKDCSFFTMWKKNKETWVHFCHKRDKTLETNADWSKILRCPLNGHEGYEPSLDYIVGVNNEESSK